MQSNKYGLQIRVPKSQQKQQQARSLPHKPLAFNDDDDDDVEKEISRQAFKNKSLKDVEDQYKKALEEDPSVFDCDGVYDDMKAKIVKPKAEDRQQRQPKYIQALMEKAKKREKEHEVVYERKLAKERSKDDHLYADKDKFVTGAYKRKLAEQARWMEEERLRELREEKDNNSLGRHGAGKNLDLLSRSYSVERSGHRHVRSRGILASARRERIHRRDEDEDDDVEEGDQEEQEEEEDAYEDEDVDDGSGPYDDYGPFSQKVDDMYETHMVEVRKGRGGRFVSRSGTSSASTVSGVSRKRSRAVNDSWVVRSEVPGGPVDGSVIPSFLGHIATRIWEDQERPSVTGLLKCHTLEKTCSFLRTWAEAWPVESKMFERLQGTGVNHVPATMHDKIDTTLITAFVERWQPDTNSFHLPFGEMTIMLHDVEAILGIRVDGKLLCAVTDADQADLLAELLAVDRAALYTEALGVWEHGGVKIASVLQRCLYPSARRTHDAQLAAYVFLLLGCTLFPDKSGGNKLRPRDIVEACDLDSVGQFSWGSATLAYLYRQLGFASRADAAGITGCLTLLQTWIYEYFPTLRPHRDSVPIDEGMPRACAWSPRSEKKSVDRLRSIRLLLDRMSPLDVNWMPFGPNPSNRVPRTLYTGLIQYREIVEAYMPQRCLRQLGFVQVVPPPPACPMKAVRSASSKDYVVHWPDIMTRTWDQFPMVARLWTAELQRPPSGVPPMCDHYYMEWFNRYSHPRLIADLDHSDADYMPSPTAVEAWMGKIMQDVQKLSMEKDSMSAPVRAAVDSLEQTLAHWKSAHWESAYKRDY